MKAHTGFNGGVQKHSQGPYFPFTIYTVGGTVGDGSNGNYHVVQHPSGLRRATFSRTPDILVHDLKWVADEVSKWDYASGGLTEFEAFELMTIVAGDLGKYVGIRVTRKDGLL